MSTMFSHGGKMFTVPAIGLVEFMGEDENGVPQFITQEPLSPTDTERLMQWYKQFKSEPLQ